MNEKIFFLILIISILFYYGCSKVDDGKDIISKNLINDKGTSVKKYKGKKILFIDSYHEEYIHSQSLTKGIKSVLDGTGIILEIYRMDTKRNQSEEFIKQSALKAKAVIERFQPDVVIAADDNASKYLIMQYYKDTDVPVVFCGVNWDASVYGFPCRNVTGMVEVALIPQIIENLKRVSKGNKIGFIAADVYTQRKEAEAYEQYFNLSMSKHFVKDFQGWKKAFRDIQDIVDILLISNSSGIEDWDEKEAKIFHEENTRIPTGTIYSWMTPFSLMGLTKQIIEQGEYAAQTALKILDGTKPFEIPLAKNKKGKVILNMKIANKLGIIFKPTLIRNAEIIK